MDLLLSVNQVEFHPLLYQKDLLAFCKEKNILLTAYSPLAHGLLLGNPVLKEIAKNRKVAQVCLRWLLDRGLVVIPKASSIEHLKGNLMLDFSLSMEETKRIDAIDEQKRTNVPAYAEF